MYCKNRYIKWKRKRKNPNHDWLSHSQGEKNQKIQGFWFLIFDFLGEKRREEKEWLREGERDREWSKSELQTVGNKREREREQLQLQLQHKFISFARIPTNLLTSVGFFTMLGAFTDLSLHYLKWHFRPYGWNERPSDSDRPALPCPALPQDTDIIIIHSTIAKVKVTKSMSILSLKYTYNF